MSATPPPPSQPPPPPPSQPPPGPAGAGARPDTGRAWWKRWWVIGAAAVVVVGMLASLGGEPADGPGSRAGETTADTAASSPTTAPADATTSAAPTPTPTAATQEPEPEPNPVAVPDVAGMSEEEAVAVVESAGLQARVEERDVSHLEDQGIVLEQRPAAGAEVTPGATVTVTVGGEFVWEDTITLEGSGDDVVDVQVPDDQVAIARISHGAGGNFAIWAYDANGDQLDLLVNDVGAYEGTRLVNLETPVREFEITAGGAWRIELAPLSQARRFAPNGTIDGTGDDVVIADESAPDASRVTLSHSGDGNFAIWAHTGRSTDLLVNDIGHYEGRVRWPGGSVVVLDITAGGAWSLVLE